MNTSNRANRAGDQLAGFVENLLQDYGYVKVTHARFFALRSLEQPIYARECYTGKTLYGGNRRVDFILYHPVKWSDCLIIECKWQARGGSVDQKFPYFVETINLNPHQAIIVLDGDGFSRNSTKWLKEQAGKENLLHVMNQGEIARFASDRKL